MTDERAFLVGRRIVDAFVALPEVTAVALAGSRVGATALGVDVAPESDLDLYVYARPVLSIGARASIADRYADAGQPIELDNQFWESGDEWRDAESGLWVDLMFRSPEWIEDRLASVLDRHEAALGYTTCFWHNVRYSRALFDRNGWYADLQRTADRPFPEELRHAIVRKNLAVLRDIHSSYLHQFDAALRRRDPAAVNHRLAALLASLFDVLFAVNRQTHPGEKRLLEYAQARCPVRPPDFAHRIEALAIRAAALDLAAGVMAAALIDDLASLATAPGDDERPIPSALRSRP